MIIAATPAAAQPAGTPCQARVPGAAHRGQPGARRARAGDPVPPIDALAVGGRIVVLSYQSLEDRIVKRVLAARSASTAPPQACPVELPEHRPELNRLRGEERGTRRRRRAHRQNPRSARCAFRAAERLRSAAQAPPYPRPLQRSAGRPAAQPPSPLRAPSSRDAAPAAQLSCAPAIVLGCLGVIFGAQLLLSIVVSSGAVRGRGAARARQNELDRTADALQENLPDLLVDPEPRAAGRGPRAWCRERMRHTCGSPTAP